ncbi:hypothetical protein ACH4ND_30685 [Streptomyces sp. NPDC017179]|uniref:hypothetical protein n=1 Tax=Streptomyces sp. NPDC017179 TaxID=3364979 RepID=UPI0037BDD224
MSQDPAQILSEWGLFTRATTTLSDGGVLFHDWYATGGEPVLMLRTADPAEAVDLVSRLAAFFADESGWHRRAADAVVAEFSEGPPEPAEPDEAAEDLILETVEVHTGDARCARARDACPVRSPARRSASRAVRSRHPDPACPPKVAQEGNCRARDRACEEGDP